MLLAGSGIRLLGGGAAPESRILLRIGQPRLNINRWWTSSIWRIGSEAAWILAYIVLPLPPNTAKLVQTSNSLIPYCKVSNIASDHIKFKACSVCYFMSSTADPNRMLKDFYPCEPAELGGGIPLPERHLPGRLQS